MKKVKYDYPEYRQKYYQKKKLKIDIINIKFSNIKDPFTVYFD